MSLNFNADGDQILTGSFDGTAIVQLLLDRFGTLGQASRSMFCRGTQAKFQVLNLSLEVICVGLHLSIRPADYGMSAQANACLSSEATLTKS